MRVPRTNHTAFSRVMHIAAYRSKAKAVRYAYKITNSAQDKIVKKSLPAIMLIAEAFSHPVPIQEIHAISSNVVKKVVTSADGDVLESKLLALANKNTNIKKVKFSSKNYSNAIEKLETPYLKSVDDFNAAIEKLLPKGKNGKENNPLYNQGEIFIEKGNKYGVNPALLASIAMLESGRGTSYAAIHRNNIGGIMSRNGLRNFKNVEECIDAMARTIKKRHNENITDVTQLGLSGKYCDKSVGAEWSKHIKSYLKKF